MSNVLIAFFSRADENYFGGSMRYIEVGNTEVVVGKIKELVNADVFKIQMKNPYGKCGSVYDHRTGNEDNKSWRT